MDRDSGFGDCRSWGRRLLEYLVRNAFGIADDSLASLDGSGAVVGSFVATLDSVDAHPVCERALRKWSLGFRRDATALRRGHRIERRGQRAHVLWRGRWLRCGVDPGRARGDECSR